MHCASCMPVAHRASGNATRVSGTGRPCAAPSACPATRERPTPVRRWQPRRRRRPALELGGGSGRGPDHVARAIAVRRWPGLARRLHPLREDGRALDRRAAGRLRRLSDRGGSASRPMLRPPVAHRVVPRILREFFGCAACVLRRPGFPVRHASIPLPASCRGAPGHPGMRPRGRRLRRIRQQRL